MAVCCAHTCCLSRKPSIRANTKRNLRFLKFTTATYLLQCQARSLYSRSSKWEGLMNHNSSPQRHKLRLAGQASGRLGVPPPKREGPRSSSEAEVGAPQSSWRHLRVAQALPGHRSSAVVSVAEEVVAAGALPGSAGAAAKAPSLR